VLEIIFGVVASMIVAWFSRQREFRADAGAAQLMGTPSSMIKALQRLQQLQEGELPKNIQALGISNHAKLASLFATHPPLEVRIQALAK
jgi:heat shock protein HtpX